MSTPRKPEKRIQVRPTPSFRVMLNWLKREKGIDSDTQILIHCATEVAKLNGYNLHAPSAPAKKKASA